MMCSMADPPKTFPRVYTEIKELFSAPTLNSLVIRSHPHLFLTRIHRPRRNDPGTRLYRNIRPAKTSGNRLNYESAFRAFFCSEESGSRTTLHEDHGSDYDSEPEKVVPVRSGVSGNAAQAVFDLPYIICVLFELDDSCPNRPEDSTGSASSGAPGGCVSRSGRSILCRLPQRYIEIWRFFLEHC